MTKLELAPFTQEEMQRFVQALPWVDRQPEVEHDQHNSRCLESYGSATYREPVASFAHWLYAQTRGQPLYLMETLKGLLEQEIHCSFASTGWYLEAGAAGRTACADTRECVDSGERA